MVLKRILPSQVEMGMYIQSFQGNWLRHPFWRASFVVDDRERLDIVRASEIDAVIIDTERGVDICAPAEKEMAAAAAPSVPHPMRPAPRRVMPPPPLRGSPIANGASLRSGPIPITREFGNARLVAGKSRKVISRVFLEARLGKVPRVAEVAPVVEDIHASIERNPYAFSGLMRCKSESEPIYRHMLSTSALMVSLARQMRLPPGESRLAGLAGLLLDVGVSQLDIEFSEGMGIASEIPAELWERHTVVGRQLLEAAGDMPGEVLRAVSRHHESVAGTGSEFMVPGGDLDLFSRMAAICDHFDLAVGGALTGVPLDPAQVLRDMESQPQRFDAKIVARFVESLGVYPIGTFVALRSGRIAMVVDQDPEAPELPVVHAFFSTAMGRHVAGHTIPLGHCFGEDAITGIADLESHGLPPATALREKVLATVQRTL